MPAALWGAGCRGLWHPRPMALLARRLKALVALLAGRSGLWADGLGLVLGAQAWPLAHRPRFRPRRHALLEL